MKTILKTLLISSSFFFSARLSAQAILKSTDGKFDLHIEQVDGQSVKDNTSLQFPKNKLFSLQLRLVPKDLSGKGSMNLEFDASMPAHNHGMPTKARATSKGDGHFLIEGIKLHMPGAWILTFKIKQGTLADTLNIHWQVK